MISNKWKCRKTNNLESMKNKNGKKMSGLTIKRTLNNRRKRK